MHGCALVPVEKLPNQKPPHLMDHEGKFSQNSSVSSTVEKVVYLDHAFGTYEVGVVVPSRSARVLGS